MKKIFEQIAADIEKEMMKAERKVEMTDKLSTATRKFIDEVVKIAKEYDHSVTVSLKGVAYTILDAIIETDMDEYDPETGRMKRR